MMNVRVNGDALELREGLTVALLVQELGLDRGPVAVERNGEVVPRAEHAATMLHEGDVIEIVHFVGGG
jgi:sulfur carrier protein